MSGAGERVWPAHDRCRVSRGLLGGTRAQISSTTATKYVPLGRPLFIYIAGAAAKRPEVKAYVDFYYTNSKAIIADSLFVPMNADQETKAKAAAAKFDAA